VGRRPLPTALKRLNGNPGKGPLNDAEPQYPTRLLGAPPNLDKTGRAEWKRLGNLLCEQRVLTEADFACLAEFCWAWQEWMKITTKIANGEAELYVLTPNGYPVPSVEMVNQKALAKQMRACEVELGLTPSSRSRIKVSDVPQADGMSELLEG
jgi:P27 family predicted phage terminase small subunit